MNTVAKILYSLGGSIYLKCHQVYNTLNDWLRGLTIWMHRLCRWRVIHSDSINGYAGISHIDSYFTRFLQLLQWMHDGDWSKSFYQFHYLRLGLHWLLLLSVPQPRVYR